MTNYSRRDVSRLVGLGLGAGLLGGATVAGAAPASAKTRVAGADRLLPLDHIVWAVPDLDAGIRTIADLTGIEPVSGGKAPGREQSHNALISLGDGAYLEIFSPARAGGGGRWGKVIEDGQPRIVSYALGVKDRFARLKPAIEAAGYGFTGPRAMGRVRPDGGAVNWELLNVSGTPLDEALPFFIDWLGSSPHPSESSPKGATIASFTVAHPRADELAAIYRGIGVDTPVLRSNKAAINLVLDTPRGKVWLS